jgi:hypothetical protein
MANCKEVAMKTVLILLGAFAVLLTGGKAFSDVFTCEQVRGCSGTAGCDDYVSISGCTIKCRAGGTVYCPSEPE